MYRKASRTQVTFGQDARRLSAPARAMRRLGAVAALTAGVLLAVQACERSPFEPVEAAPAVRSPSRRADLDPAVNIAMLLDSLAIGGVYSITPRGGYSSLRYTPMPERAVYANPIRGHPTGIELPVGLPVRVLAEGAVVSHSTPTFLTSYCARYGGGDSHCATPSYTYAVHGLAPDGVLTNPYALGTGLQVQWSRLGGRYAAPYPSPEFFSGAIPASGATTTAELHFRREAGCCYYPPFGDAAYTAWETYEGQWRFAVVMDDGGRPENGVPALLTLSGPRTNQPMADSATFTLTAADGGTLSETRWWFIQPASNAFDGEPLPFVQEPSSGLMVPRYPDGQRSVITEIPACAAQSTCRYQAAHPGALVAMAKMPNGSYLGAGNRGLNRPHVRITVDSTTLAQGDTTVFRTTAPGAKELRVTGYSFVPSAPVTASAMRGSRALRVPSAASGGPALSASSPQRLAVRQGTSGSATEGVTARRGGRKAHFLDATFDCSDAMDTVCYDNPSRTGYEVVTAKVDGELQRDSVLVEVVPAAELVLRCSDARGVSDATGGTTVVRGQSVICRASLSPDGSTARLTVTQWIFVSTDSTLTRNRNETNPSFDPDSTVWAGPMITSGSVTVTAAVGNGSPSTRAALITVTPRDWSREPIPDWPLKPDSIGQGWLPPQPADVHDLGQIRAHYLDNGMLKDSAQITSPVRSRVDEGPNAFFYYLPKLPRLLDWIKISINETALKKDSDFWKAQIKYDPNVVYSSENWCYREDVISEATLKLIKGHEGTTWDTIPISHAGRRMQLTREMVVPAVERVFAKADLGEGAIMDRWFQLVTKMELKVDTLSDKPVDTENPVLLGSLARRNVGCNFRYTYTP